MGAGKTKLSVIIITYNEGHQIRRCLESVKWADEIIVVDSGSSDDTVKVCSEYTDKLYARQFDNFASQKNVALSHATHEWVLSVDADEQLPDELIGEIKDAIQSGSHGGYYLKRKNYVYGAFLNYASKDYHLRLFRRQGARFVSPIHEYVESKGTRGYLSHYFYHYTMPTLANHVKKINLYTDCYLEKYPKMKITKWNALWYLFLRGIVKFIQHYFIRCAYKDGLRGFIFAINSIFAEFCIYAKIWERQTSKNRFKKGKKIIL